MRQKHSQIDGIVLIVLILHSPPPLNYTKSPERHTGTRKVVFDRILAIHETQVVSATLGQKVWAKLRPIRPNIGRILLSVKVEKNPVLVKHCTTGKAYRERIARLATESAFSFGLERCLGTLLFYCFLLRSAVPATTKQYVHFAFSVTGHRLQGK